MPVFLALIFLVILGAIVGSFLNVCIYRVPLEKSILWPGSHCGKCLQAIRWYDNVPLVSYWILRGRCRSCGASYSIRYFLIELLTGICFAGLFYLEAIRDVHHLAVFGALQKELALSGNASFDPTSIPLAGWGFLAYHAVLVSLLIVASFIDLDLQYIPISITLTGTVLGLIGGACLWPSMPATATKADNPLGIVLNLSAISGVYPWPIWLSPLPAWLSGPPVWTGLVTGLAGTLAGMLVLRGVRFVHQLGRGIEGMGLGDADVMMMVGSFLGWQPTILGFFMGVFVGLFFGIVQLFKRGDQMFPFGPSLAIGVLITMLSWSILGPRFAQLLFDGTLMLSMLSVGAVLLFVVSFGIRLVRGLFGR
jgi:leader peptidase (prepilin peptidase)/N-methyltransferase